MTEKQKKDAIKNIAYKLRSMYKSKINFFTETGNKNHSNTVMFCLEDGCYLAYLDRFLRGSNRFIRRYNTTNMNHICFKKNKADFRPVLKNDYCDIVQDIYNVFEK